MKIKKAPKKTIAKVKRPKPRESMHYGTPRSHGKGDLNAPFRRAERRKQRVKDRKANAKAAKKAGVDPGEIVRSERARSRAEMRAAHVADVLAYHRDHEAGS